MIDYQRALLAAINDDGTSAVPNVDRKEFQRFLAVRKRKNRPLQTKPGWAKIITFLRRT